MGGIVHNIVSRKFILHVITDINKKIRHLAIIGNIIVNDYRLRACKN